MLLFIFFQNIFAYIGPGMGVGIIAVILGILISFVLSLFAIFWYPIKKLIRFIKSKFGK